jgi:hypothetical protein
MARQRNYAAEYARRKQLGQARGLSLSQIRGHPSGTESAVQTLRESGIISTPRQESTLQKVYRAVDNLGKQSGKQSLERAARDAGISPSTVRRIATERGLLDAYYRYKTTESGAVVPTNIVERYEVEYAGTVPIITDTGEIFHPDVDTPTASLLAVWQNAVDDALHGRPAALREFAKATIIDLHGHTWRLMTDPDTIRRIFASMSEDDLAAYERDFDLTPEGGPAIMRNSRRLPTVHSLPRTALGSCLRAHYAAAPYCSSPSSPR